MKHKYKKVSSKTTGRKRKKWHQADSSLLIILGLLLVGGLIMLSSASSIIAYSRFGDSYHYLKNQLFGVGVGLVLFFIFYNIDYHFWKKKAIYFLFGSIAVLLLVFVPGLQADYGTAQSWINVAGFSFQPSELVKLFFLIYFAAWIAVKKTKFNKIREGWGPLFFIIGIIVFLMLRQPDLGTLSIILGSVFMVMLASKEVKFKFILIVLTVGVVGISLLVSLKGYQSDRIKCFQDSDFSKNDACYQLNQSLIAVGSGGVWGRGLGQSRQKFMYLPEVTADSVFSVIAEEMGFVFTLIFIALYFLLFYRGFLIAKKAPDNFGLLLSIGIVSWISIQAILNIGGMIKLIPMTGVPLPFVSYGGSAMISALMAMGVLANISRQTET